MALFGSFFHVKICMKADLDNNEVLVLSTYTSTVNKLERRPHLQGNVVVLTRLKTSFYPTFSKATLFSSLDSKQASSA